MSHRIKIPAPIVVLAQRLLGALVLSCSIVSFAHAATSTKNPSANAAVTSSAGDNDGYLTNPGNAYANDNSYAVDTNSGVLVNGTCEGTGSDKHSWRTFGFSIPGGATIDGITVGQRIFVDLAGGSSNAGISVRLSWGDCGSNFTAWSTRQVLADTETLHTFGGASNTWSRTWTPSEFNDGTFCIQTCNSDEADTAANRDFSLDEIYVIVNYTPVAGARRVFNISRSSPQNAVQRYQFTQTSSPGQVPTISPALRP